MLARPAPPVPDELLFQRWVAGDASAGEELFKRHFDPLLRFFRRQVGDDVQDLVQQTFLGCIEARTRYAELANFRAFLYAIARNQLYKHLRRRSGQPFAQISVTSVAALLPTPSRLLGDEEEIRLLVEALGRLPLEQQLTLYFYYVLDLTAPQTGDALGGVGVPAVRSRLRRGLAALRVHLESQHHQTDKGRDRCVATLDQWEANLPVLPAGESAHDDEVRLPSDID